MSNSIPLACLGFLLVVGGCGGVEEVERSADTSASLESGSTPSAAEVVHEWAVTASGAGPVRIGMSRDELTALLAAPSDTSELASECTYVQVAGAPQGMGFMLVNGELARIDVTAGETPTAEGARIGDSEARILELYPTASRGPHKYTDGAYLVVIPESTDTLSRLVFETDGQQVTRFRGGMLAPVEWVEGCG